MNTLTKSIKDITTNLIMKKKKMNNDLIFIQLSMTDGHSIVFNLDVISFILLVLIMHINNEFVYSKFLNILLS